MRGKAFHIHFYGGKQWKIVHTGGKAFVVDSSYNGKTHTATMAVTHSSRKWR